LALDGQRREEDYQTDLIRLVLTKKRFCVFISKYKA
jgi:hypothetical protein